MIMIEGGCDICGRYTQITFDVNEYRGVPKLVCNSCWDKYYSKEAIRGAKLKGILNRGIF